MNLPCPHRNLCPENPFENLSSEDFDVDHSFCYGSYPGSPPGAGRDWSTGDCGGCTVLQGPVSCMEIGPLECSICVTKGETNCGNQSAYVDADCNPLPITCNVDTPCTIDYPDGRHYTYTLPAGSVCLPSQALADQAAQDLACQIARKRTCNLTPIPRCTCVGTPYIGQIFDSDSAAAGWTLHYDSGMLPPGLHLSGRVITGTPTTAGTYNFGITAADPQGNSCSMLYTISVLRITTTTLPSYTVGTPYSYQLSVTGGGGNYGWSLESGSLPDGITLSETGLLSGTPTASNGTLSAKFSVVDKVCEATQRSHLPPKVVLTTTSHTTIRTKHGWTDYSGNIYGTLYKTLTPVGWMYQLACNINENYGYPGFTYDYPFAGGSRYDYAGYSAIDLYGTLTSKHEKNLRVVCPNPALYHVNGPVYVGNNQYTLSGVFFNLNRLDGYCWPPDPSSCQTCSSDQADWVFLRNDGVADIWDYPHNMTMDRFAMTSPNPTTLAYDSFNVIAGVLIQPNPPPNWPTVVIWPYVDYRWPWAGIVAVGQWTITLSDPYTDAEAEASKVAYDSNGKVATIVPNWKVWNSNYMWHRSDLETSVDYTLHCTNLVPGQNYTAKAQLLYGNGSITTVSFPFQAITDTHDAHGTIPTPAVNTHITVKSPTLIYT